MSGLRARAVLNLVLLLVAGTLIAFIWLGPASKQAPEAARLSRLDANTVTRVRIERAGQPPLVLERDGVLWRIKSPSERPANGIKVAALLGLASARVHDAFRAIGNDLAAFGLEPPAARVWFDNEAFTFGDTDPLNGWRYVLHGPDVHLITDAYFHHILATPPAYLDPAPLAQVSRPVGVSVMPATRQASKQEGGTSPAAESAVRHPGKKLVEAWVAARATAVRALDSRLPWTGAVRVSLPDGKPDIRFQVARLEHEVAFGRRDWAVQYHFPRAAGELLLGAE